MSLISAIHASDMKHKTTDQSEATRGQSNGKLITKKHLNHAVKER